MSTYERDAARSGMYANISPAIFVRPFSFITMHALSGLALRVNICIEEYLCIELEALVFAFFKKIGSSYVALHHVVGLRKDSRVTSSSFLVLHVEDLLFLSFFNFVI